MSEEESKGRRRVRYNGTHPKSFKEKYKELNPESYLKDVEKIIQQGKTPAGMHRSICVSEIMTFLKVVLGQVGLDATLGYGGHSLEILKCLSPNGLLFAMDVDPFELPKTEERLLALGYGSKKHYF
jgi:16S rRNA (cytosine1402-N4)-methyltransferase